MDHISALLALAVDGPIDKAVITFLDPAYSQQEAETVWAAWAPHLSTKPDHPLAARTLLRDAVLQILRTPYPSAKLARDAAIKLVDDIAKEFLT